MPRRHWSDITNMSGDQARALEMVRASRKAAARDRRDRKLLFDIMDVCRKGPAGYTTDTLTPAMTRLAERGLIRVENRWVQTRRSQLGESVFVLTFPAWLANNPIYERKRGKRLIDLDPRVLPGTHNS